MRDERGSLSDPEYSDLPRDLDVSAYRPLGRKSIVILILFLPIYPAQTLTSLAASNSCGILRVAFNRELQRCKPFTGSVALAKPK